ncbi:hypothetical protein KGD82_26375 [Nocardiopsis eucommiae]|uniref:Outer membrane channel protein CpnT-like N-terminal domain-containing protein n=1 Tax=Nocardiopsis eucommiae TaxID=2831970 RepID=A0A975LA92_9ACTN|nr:hypothetical protein KGD82_26375 [Nocardiopsis eucommiae]
MGMELPAELRNLFSVLTGSEWPTADETRLWELAQVYGTTADQLEVELPQLVIRIKNKVRENFDATAADFFDQSVDEFTAGQNNYLGEGTKVARGLQEYVHNAGTQVQYAKWMIIGQLVQLALEIAWAIAMAPYTFGASLAKIPIFQAIARTVIGRVMFRLLSTLLQQMAISQFFALTLDALIQRIQIDQGNRDGWDHKLTEDAAKGAMLDGLFGTAAVFGGSALSGQFNKLLGNTTGPSITKHLDDNFPTGGPGGGPGGLPEGIGSVMGRNSDELLRPYGMDNRPGWNRPIDGERFRTDMGDQFANSLGGSMGKDQAREFGNAYADAFTRNWGRNGLDDALNDVVSKYGRGLDPNMRDFLTTGVPASVRDGLSDVGTHWKNFLAQLGGQGIANAAQGMLSEGFFNLLFSDEKSFSITWLSGVSGLVSGAVQQSLTQGGLLLIDHLRNAGLPEGVPPPTPTPSPTDDGLNDHRGGDGSPDGNENVSTSDSGSSSSNGPGSNNSSSEGAGGGSRDGRGDGSQNSTPPPPPPPQRVSTESSDTNDQDNTGSATPEPPSNENNGSNEGPATEDSPGRGSDRPVDNADENTGGDDSDHLNRGGQENSNSEGGGPGDAPVVGGQERDTGGQDRSPEQTGDGEGAGAADGPETPNGDQGGPENTPAEGSQNQETPAPTPNPPVQEPPVSETPAPTPAPPVQETPTPTPTPPVQETPAQETPVQETPAPTPNPPVQETPAPNPNPAPPVQETPVQETPVQESPAPAPAPPVQETPNPTPAPPVQETPVSETPVQETPTPNPPVQDASGDGEVGGGGPARENGGDTAPVRETPNQEQPAQDSPNPNPPVQERPVVDTSGDGVVRDTDGPVRENGAEDTPVQESPVQEQPAGDGVVREPGGSEDANGPEGTPVRETPEQNVPVQESPNQDAPVRETPNQEESNTGRPDLTTDDQGGRSTDQDTPAQGSQDATDGNGQTSTGPSPNAGGQGSSDGNANTHRPNGSGRDGGPETVTDHETGSDDTRTSQDGTGADVRPPGDRPSGESDSDATVHQNGDQQGRQNDDDSQGSTRDEDGSGAPVRQDDGSNESTARPDGTPVPVVMAPPLHPGAQGGQESTGDGRRQPPPGNQTNTPPVSRPRPDPDAPAPVSDRMRPPADWQNIRDSIEPTRVGATATAPASTPTVSRSCTDPARTTRSPRSRIAASTCVAFRCRTPAPTGRRTSPN